ncbi:DNA helicase UvrD [Candidatus Parcubacteria bacterium]|nr:DNA helicase UvrD [Candidatus Parcubacteria bacterium]
MMFIADFHIHSKYSRATSPKTDLEHLSEFAKIKGIDILGTGDFTHPQWLKELKDQLEPAEPGLYRFGRTSGLRPLNQETRFILTSEISCIYSKAGKVRKVHIVVLAPSIQIVEKINSELAKIGNLKADGRPILGLDAKELAKIVLNVSEDCLIIPAHCMTPWFGVFGSKSGFDSLEECFEDYTKYIYALETGLSADPAMLWRLPDGRRTTLISNSDAHSPGKLGREANVFEGSDKISYNAITSAIKAGGDPSSDQLKLGYTIEFYPQEGKYHYDGHRECDVSLSPEESKKYNNLCPSCGRPLTIGVMNRIEQLADKPEGFKPDNAIPFKSLVPLLEIIGEALGVGPASKRVAAQYDNLIKEVGSEFHILLNAKQNDMSKASTPEIAEGIVRVRQGRVNVEPGYDGVFGKVRFFSKIEKKNFIRQKILF